MKLEIKHLAGYLPCGLMALVTDQRFNNGFAFLDKITGIYEDLVTFNDSPDWYFDSDENDTEIKLALRPLSDLTEEEKKEIHSRHPNLPNYQEFYEEWINEKGLDLSETIIEYAAMQFLLEHHFDVFGLIEQNLAIDKNTL